jgi:mycofactocin precursor
MEHTPPSTHEFPLTEQIFPAPDAAAPIEQTDPVDEIEALEEIEEELIIEDFTIDGICGVY